MNKRKNFVLCVLANVKNKSENKSPGDWRGQLHNWTKC
jgi:hypothetical protein